MAKVDWNGHGDNPGNDEYDPPSPLVRIRPAKVPMPTDLDRYGLAVPGQLTVLYGPKESFKSLIVQQTVVDVCRTAPVSLIDSEATPPSVLERLAKLMNGSVEEFDPAEHNIRALSGLGLIRSPRDWERAVLDAAVGGDPPARLVVVDSFYGSFPGDELNSRDVREWLSHLQRWQLTTGCAFLVVHHTNASGQRIAGHGFLSNAVDRLFRAERRGRTNSVVIRCEKNRLGPPLEPVHFRVETDERLALIRVGASPVQTSAGETPKNARALEAIRASENGISTNELRKLLRLSGSSVQNVKKDLLALDLVRISEDGRLVARPTNGVNA